MKAWSKFLVATLVVAMVVAVAGCKPVSAQSGTVTHVVRQGETLYSISRAYGVSVSCWGLADPNRIYPGQVLTCGGGDYYTEQTYQAPSQQQVYQQTYTTNVSGAVTHTVRRGETLYSISRAYGVSVSCWGLADPNRIYEGQVLTCGASTYTQQPYQAPAQQQVYAQPADAYVGNQIVVNAGMPGWLSQDIALGGTWWCVLRGATWYISRSSSGSNMMTYDDTNGVCSGYANTTQISGSVVPSQVYQQPTPRPTTTPRTQYSAVRTEYNYSAKPLISFREPTFWCGARTIGVQILCGLVGGTIAELPGLFYGMAACSTISYADCIIAR